MLSTIWQDYLYTPLLNFLVWLYMSATPFSLGLAIIYLTLILRFLLLPLSIISERNKVLYEKVAHKIKEYENDYRQDPVKKREMIRALLKKEKLRPWAKVVVLGSQLLVLVLLYQTFLGGMSLEKLDVLYEWVPRPDFINTQFLTIDISQRNMILSGVVAVVLFWHVYFEQYTRRHILTSSDVFFRYLFPLAMFLVLILLPSVKALFILTSIFFSFGVFIIRLWWMKFIKKPQAQSKARPQIIK